MQPERIAVACARTMQAALRGLNEEFKTDGLPEVRMGIGLHPGELVAGNMGAENQLNCTVIGDTVNLASRLESEFKRYASSLIFSQATLEAASLPVESVINPGSLQVRRRQQSVQVFTIKDLIHDPERTWISHPVKLISIMFLFLVYLSSAVYAWPNLTRSEREFDHALSNFGGMLQFSRRINPDARIERQTFFAALARGENYEPQFHYQPLPEKLHQACRDLESMPRPMGAWSELLSAVRTDLLLKYRILCNRGRSQFTAEAIQLYSLPDSDLQLAALKILRLTDLNEPRTASMSPATMQEKLTVALKKFSLSGWQVILSDGMSARASVLSGSRKVKINQQAEFFACDAERLIHHELGVHAIRAERGRMMPLRIFRTGLAGYLDTEEGLAAWTETRRGITAGLRLFAMRVLAIHWASREPFSLVFRRLRTLGASKSEAWTLTLRAKRGLGDTGQPGCWPKDAVYLRGYLLVKDWVEAGGDVKKLKRFGKTGLHDLLAIEHLRNSR